MEKLLKFIKQHRVLKTRLLLWCSVDEAERMAEELERGEEEAEINRLMTGRIREPSR